MKKMILSLTLAMTQTLQAAPNLQAHEALLSIQQVQRKVVGAPEMDQDVRYLYAGKNGKETCFAEIASSANRQTGQNGTYSSIGFWIGADHDAHNFGGVTSDLMIVNQPWFQNLNISNPAGLYKIEKTEMDGGTQPWSQDTVTLQYLGDRSVARGLTSIQIVQNKIHADAEDKNITCNQLELVLKITPREEQSLAVRALATYNQLNHAGATNQPITTANCSLETKTTLACDIGLATDYSDDTLHVSYEIQNGEVKRIIPESLEIEPGC